ncbi:hypothetical protein D3C87_928880 [compost metagenome]
MISKLLIPALAASLFLSGCSVTFGPMAQPRAVANGSAVLQLSTEVFAGGYRTQTAVTPYTASDIALLKLTLHKVDGQGVETAVNDAQGQPLALNVPQARLNDPVQFTKLNANTTYRIKAAAYLDTNGTQLISTADARSRIDIPIVQEDRPTLARIKVQLIDKSFDGQGSTTVDVSSGSLIPAGSESMSITLPGPV